MVQLDTEHIHLRRSSVCNLRDEKKHRRETIVRDERPRVNFEKRYRVEEARFDRDDDL